MVAAHQVTEATFNAKEPTIMEQKKLLDIAREIGKEMELLSIAAQKGSIEDLIAISKKLAGMIDGVQKNAIEIANKCTDPILKEQLLAVCKVPKNFSVQLKIIAAVKAASLAKHDKSAEYQLVVCAQGLANSVIQTVKASEAASLKVPKTGGSFTESTSTSSELSSSTESDSPKQSSFFQPKAKKILQNRMPNLVENHCHRLQKLEEKAFLEVFSNKTTMFIFVT